MNSLPENSTPSQASHPEGRRASSYTKKDFMSDQTVRWCPGCGDYAILAQTQSVFAELGIPREKFVVVSGIGCSSRFPYYMNTYGFHAIHGRAPAVATGLKLSRPELSVWIVTGDGDGLSIGGNHLIHVLRRNVDVQILLFNNRIYALTKGQYSPTSEVGMRSKSTPMGSVDHPFVPCRLALGADATFIARTVDVFVKEQRQVLREAHAHKGASFVEILQNCNTFNDGVFSDVTDRNVRHERVVFVEHGKPLLYGGKNGSPVKGLRLTPELQIESVQLGPNPTEDEIAEAGILVHDETNRLLAELLVGMEPPLPVAMGVIRRVQRSTYEADVAAQIEQACSKRGAGDLTKALYGANTWVVK